jgi:prepilin-type N-terminal cleavage/methylation domain-containing protein
MNRNNQSPRVRGHAGFTLLELLAVMLILAVLMGIMTQAAQLVIRAAREKRLTMTTRTLETALARYRDEYRQWPIDEAHATVNGFEYTVTGDDNKHWFAMLRENSPANSRNIRFVDETTIFTLKDGKPIPLHKAAAEGVTPPHPFVGVNRRREPVYFNIRIDTDKDTVRVYTQAVPPPDDGSEGG